MKKVYYTWRQVADSINGIILEMFKEDWKPELIVGLTRGGLAPAVLLSNKTGIPMETLDVRLRDTFNGYQVERNTSIPSRISKGKNVLIVDDINDTGETLEWIKNDWGLDSHWHDNLRVACITNNDASCFDIDYTSKHINKIETPQWIVFPWEE
jgi:hypoxanthine phosphoribosyltransferase